MEAVTPLLALLADSESSARWRAASALARMQIVKTVPLIVDMARYPYGPVAQQFITALIHLAPEEAVSLLDSFPQDGLCQIVWHARLSGQALLRLGNIAQALASFRQ